MPTPPKTILFAGGGSGGHITPILAVMEAVQAQYPEVECAFVGLAKDVTSPLITESNLTFKTYSIHAGKLHRYLTIDLFRQGVWLVRGFFEAALLLRKVKPDRIFCKGSMVSVPIALAARMQKIPIYSHETDLIPGLANRMVSRVATGIFTAFTVAAYTSLPAHKLIYTGQPVRKEFYHPNTHLEVQVGGRVVPKDRPVVTIIGGSQGAHRINQLIADSWQILLERVTLIHICGSHDVSELTWRLDLLSPEARERLFLTDFQTEGVAEVFAMSEVVVSRAGGTIAELAAVGCPTILIPLSTAAQNHQWANAEFLQKAEAAVVVDETKVTSSDLVGEIEGLLDDQSRRRTLSKHIKSLARPDAAATMATTLYQSGSSV